ncbi:MAG: GntR family transcriptional regulator [Desulfobacterales bacterium]|nr:GntR family transcriptional regulator [Desulfobacterales bacterium]MCP4159999.1 GntR family transcriptional regulator [Deltaproteobacteria bacterium]
MLNSKSPLPLYHQLADILTARIKSGEYAVGSKIPPELSLAQLYSIGRPTVRQAIDLLVRKKLVERKRGSGTYVIEEEKEIDLFSLAGTSSAFSEKGISTETCILQDIKIKKINSKDNPFKTALFFSRLTSVGKSPVLVENFYLNQDVFEGIKNIDIKGKSLAKIVRENFFMEPTDFKQSFKVVAVPKGLTKELGLKTDSKILLIQRWINFPQIKNGVYSEMYCRTDKFVFSQTVGG